MACMDELAAALAAAPYFAEDETGGDPSWADLPQSVLVDVAMRLRTLHGAVTMRRVCPAWAAGIAAGLKQLTLSEDELHRLACFPNLTHLTVERARVQPQRPQQQAPAGVAPAAQQPPPLPLAQRLRLPRLCHLSLQCCERLQGELAADTPATVQLLSGLTALELASNTPGALPAWALQLPQLQALHVLGWRPLTSGLPDGLWALHQLRSLRIQPAGGYSLAMPDGLSNLTALTRLDLSSGHAAPAGGLSALPEGLGALAELQELVLAHAHLKALPASLTALSSLTLLNCDACHNMDPHYPQLAALPQLRELTLAGRVDSVSSAAAPSLPASLSALTQLTAFTAAPGFGSAPETLEPLLACTALRSLALRFWLHALPPALTRLQQLEQLGVEIVKHLSDDVVLGLPRLSYLHADWDNLSHVARERLMVRGVEVELKGEEMPDDWMHEDCFFDDSDGDYYRDDNYYN